MYPSLEEIGKQELIDLLKQFLSCEPVVADGNMTRNDQVVVDNLLNGFVHEWNSYLGVDARPLT